MVRKQAVRGLRKGVVSMYYIHSFLITEDDLENPDNTGCTNFDKMASTGSASRVTDSGSSAHGGSPSGPTPEWCVWGVFRPMPQEIETKCCKQHSMCWNYVYETQVTYQMIIQEHKIISEGWLPSVHLGKTRLFRERKQACVPLWCGGTNQIAVPITDWCLHGISWTLNTLLPSPRMTYYLSTHAHIMGITNMVQESNSFILKQI